MKLQAILYNNWPQLYPRVTEADIDRCEEFGFYPNGQREATGVFQVAKWCDLTYTWEDHPGGRMESELQQDKTRNRETTSEASISLVEKQGWLDIRFLAEVRSGHNGDRRWV